MTKRITVTFTDEQAKVIERIAQCREKSFAEVVRELCEEAMKSRLDTESLDLACKMIEKSLNSVMEGHINRLMKLTEKSATMSASATFLNAEALNKFIPEEQRMDFKEAYEKARYKAIAYLIGSVPEEDELEY